MLFDLIFVHCISPSLFSPVCLLCCLSLCLSPRISLTHCLLCLSTCLILAAHFSHLCVLSLSLSDNEESAPQYDARYSERVYLQQSYGFGDSEQETDLGGQSGASANQRGESIIYRVLVACVWCLMFHGLLPTVALIISYTIMSCISQ